MPGGRPRNKHKLRLAKPENDQWLVIDDEYCYGTGSTKQDAERLLGQLDALGAYGREKWLCGQYGSLSAALDETAEREVWL